MARSSPRALGRCRRLIGDRLPDPSGTTKVLLQMAISDRTRKLLWGCSGNRCAICRCPLAVQPTSADPAAVIGEECHIIAQSAGGPRAGEIQAEALDDVENLVLLCRNDHRRVDEQPSYFTTERLRAIKIAHETWVDLALSNPHPPPAKGHVTLPVREPAQQPSELEVVIVSRIAESLRSRQSITLGQLTDELEALKFKDYKGVTIIAVLQAMRRRRWIWWDESRLRDAVIEWNPEHQAVLDMLDTGV